MVTLERLKELRARRYPSKAKKKVRKDARKNDKKAWRI